MPAVQILLAYCKPPNITAYKVPSDRISEEHPSISLERHRSPATEHGPKQDPKKTFTSADLQYLVHLKENLLYAWSDIAAEFPCWTRDSLFCRYRRWLKKNPSAIVERPFAPSALPKPSTSHENGKYTPEDDQLIIDLKQNSMTWPQIKKFFPGRSRKALRTRYSFLNIHNNPYTPEDDRLFVELKNTKLDWLEIATHFHGRSPDALKNYYYNSLKESHTIISNRDSLGERGYSEMASAETNCFKPKRRRTGRKSKCVEEGDSSEEVDSDYEELWRQDGDDDDDDLASGDEDSIGSQ